MGTRLAIIILVVLGGCSPGSDLKSLRQLDASQRISLSAWLKQHTEFRPAADADCNCDGDIKEMRQRGPWGYPIPHYQPYLSTGNFNGDGTDDFAVITIDKDKPSRRKLLVFNGPFSEPPVSPALSQDIGSSEAIFWEPANKRLLVGPFASEGCIIKPKGSRYTLDCDSGG